MSKTPSHKLPLMNDAMVATDQYCTSPSGMDLALAQVSGKVGSFARNT